MSNLSISASVYADASSGRFFLVLEYAAAGDLAQLIDRRRRYSCPLTETEIWHLFTQVLQSTNYRPLPLMSSPLWSRRFARG